MIGSEVWHISVYDGDGDTITLTTAFTPAAACAGLFSVNAAGTCILYQLIKQVLEGTMIEQKYGIYQCMIVIETL